MDKETDKGKFSGARFFTQMPVEKAKNFIWAAEKTGIKNFFIDYDLKTITRWTYDGSFSFDLKKDNVAVLDITQGQDYSEVWKLYYLVEGYSMSKAGNPLPPGVSED